MAEPRGNGKAEVAARMGLRTATGVRDWEWVARTLERYGNYLLLVGDNQSVGEVRVFEPPG